MAAIVRSFLDCATDITPVTLSWKVYLTKVAPTGETNPVHEIYHRNRQIKDSFIKFNTTKCFYTTIKYYHQTWHSGIAKRVQTYPYCFLAGFANKKFIAAI